MPDGCEADCDGDVIPDTCESDCNGDGTPNDCDPDCQPNGISDICDILSGTSQDCTGPNWAANGIPDECDIATCPAGELGCFDCQPNGVPDGCEADCDSDGVPDTCEPDCDGNGVPDDCEPDCNGNGVADPCDIASGTSLDCDDSGAPDKCEPAAEAAGSRYIEITPGGMYLDEFGVETYLDENTDYAIQVWLFPTAGEQCDPAYLQTGGTIIIPSDPGFVPESKTPAAWCTEYAHGSEVIPGPTPYVPGATYGIVAEDAADGAVSLGEFATCAWGDVDCDGDPWIFDVSCVLNCVRGLFTEVCTPLSCDQAPAVVQGECAPPDGQVDVRDLVAVLDATLRGMPYPCTDPCYTGPPTAYAQAAATGETSATASPSSTVPNGYVNVDVFVSGLVDLRGYEVSVSITKPFGTIGSLTPVNAWVTKTRSDYVFYGLVSDPGDLENADYIDTVDTTTWRIDGALVTGSVDTTTPKYVGTVRFKASANANGTFYATAVEPGTRLLNEINATVGLASTTSATIVVTGLPPIGSE